MFETHQNCKDCPLCESASSPGISTRPFDIRPGMSEPRKKTAFLIVGKSPGFSEDRRGACFTGYAGQLLESFIEATKLPDLCDVYLANAVRCLPPQGANESQSQIRACRKYLERDVEEIKEAGYDRIVILALGAKAVYSTLNITSLTEAMKQQGAESPVFPGIRVFCTYHPNMLHARRSPAKVGAVEAHFRLVTRHLAEGFIPYQLEIKVELGAKVPKTLPEYVGCDIETYGLIKGFDQTVFHPMKSLVVDGIPLKEQTKMVSFAWEEGDTLRTAEYIFRIPKHRRLIRAWFKRIIEQGSKCTGQNIKFDLLYLYHSGDTVLQYLINPSRLKVDDTLLWMFLFYEQQPEKGLKELCALFGLADYSKMKVTGKTGNAKSDTDPDALYYNCLDSAATIVLRKYLEQQIRERYGADSSKLSAVCEWMRNAVIWDVFDLEQNGSSFNIRKLEAVHETEKTRCLELLTSAEETYEIKLAGTGSDAPLRQLMLDSLDEAGLTYDPRVEWTKKEGKPSIGAENIALVSEALPSGRNLEIITAFQEYGKRSKIVSTYTRPTLMDSRKGIVVRKGNVGLVFPSWFPIPTYDNRGGSAEDKAGGQIQGRFSCKKPARMTEPKSIRVCSCSRWTGGKILEYDVNQDHLRMAALLSGDPVLMGAYETEGESAHTRTAITIFPQYAADREGFKKLHPLEYALGKTINFLMLFKGGAKAFQANAMADCHTELSLGFCEAAIRTWYQRHYVYGQWQDELIRKAGQQGYLVLPTGWSRTFGIGRENAEAQAGEICNFMHQAPCGQVLQSSHFKAKRLFYRRKMKSVFCLQLYDALYVDTYPGEEADVDEVMDEVMIHPPLLPVFENWVGRTLPWAYERKEYAI